MSPNKTERKNKPINYYSRLNKIKNAFDSSFIFILTARGTNIALQFLLTITLIGYLKGN